MKHPQSKSTSGNPSPEDYPPLAFESSIDIPPLQSVTPLPEEDPRIYDIARQRKRAIGFFCTKMEWSSRRGGNVIIENTLPLRNSAWADWINVPCSLIVKRSALIDYLIALQQAEARAEQRGGQSYENWNLPMWCAFALWHATRAGRPSNRRPPHSFQLSSLYTAFQLRVGNEALENLKRFFTEGVPSRSQDWADAFRNQVVAAPEGWLLPGPGATHCPWLHLTDLAINILVWLLDLSVLRLVQQRPRGKSAWSPQTWHIEKVLAHCEDLIHLSHKSSEVRAALEQARRTVQLDPQLSDYLRTFNGRPDALTVVLAQRWFRRRNIDVDLIGKAPYWHSPREILQRYLFKGQYREHGEFLETIYQRDPSMRQHVFETWIKAYLDIA